MNIKIVIAVILFLAWRNGHAQQQATKQVNEAVPLDPYGSLSDMWGQLQGPGVQHAGPNDISAGYSTGLDGSQSCPPGAFC